MKLRGTRTENEYRAELICTHEHQFGAKSVSAFKNVLLKLGENPDNAYILEWIPDQGEDILLIYLSGDRLVSIELDRNDSKIAPIVEYRDFHAYTQKQSKSNQIKLAVAQELSNATA
ncbi:MAG: hypothetical protein HKN88_08240 [Gammaproteobacteria bacterium]|nr:hypothetical protein [Gammaproteobacteria bacterium]NNM14599.1 hypothetical protein [Gammaproteobacteria bacterium]